MFGFLARQDIGIDLGTANCMVCVKGRIVVSEPSVVAVNKETNEIICDGKEAKEMLGKTPSNIQVIRPLREGVISQYDMTLRMLQSFIEKACGGFHLRKPRVIVCVPSSINEVEERSVVEAAKNAGAGIVYLIEEPVAAAMGAGIDISDTKGNMVVDIGGGTTDIAVISMDNVVVSESVKVAGDRMNDAIKDYVRRKYNLLIGDLTAEDIKTSIGNVYRQTKPTHRSVKGRCLAEGIPREITLSSTEMLEAMLNPISTIIDAICQVLERTPPELVPDIMNNGIVLTGGGALLGGLDQLITEVTGIHTRVAPDPINCVAHGTEKSLSKLNVFSESSVNLSHVRLPKF